MERDKVPKTPRIVPMPRSNVDLTDIIFINTPYYDYAHFSHHTYPSLPPIGLGYLATWLQQQGFVVELIDAEYEGLTPRQIADRVNAKQPRFVGLNILTPTYNITREILKHIDANTTIVVGGPHVQALPLELMNDPNMRKISYCVCGDGEFKLQALLQASVHPKEIPGIAYRVNGEVFFNMDKPCDPRWNPLNLDALPFIDRHFLLTDPFWSENRLEVNILASRGCPFKCSFCAGSSDVQQRTPLHRSVTNIIAEIQHLVDQYDVTAIRFVDDLFFFSKRFVREFLKALKDSGLVDRLVWNATARADFLLSAENDLLDALSESGCRQLSIGIESASPRIQHYIKKGVTPSAALKLVRILSERNIRTSGYFVVGFPGETEKEIRDTISLFHQLRLASSNSRGNITVPMFRGNIFQFLPYPNTQEWQRLVHAGYSPEKLLNSYSPISMKGPFDERMRRRWSTTIQFGSVAKFASFSDN